MTETDPRFPYVPPPYIKGMRGFWLDVRDGQHTGDPYLRVFEENAKWAARLTLVCPTMAAFVIAMILALVGVLS